MMNIQRIIEQYKLRPHPEGGFYTSVWQARCQLTEPPRAAASVIYYLLGPGEKARWHRLLRSEELWLWLEGAAVTLTLGGAGSAPAAAETAVLNDRFRQRLIPANVWQKAVCGDSDGALMACIVSPGYDDEDWQLFS